jgi:hypothetical protein
MKPQPSHWRRPTILPLAHRVKRSPQNGNEEPGGSVIMKPRARRRILDSRRESDVFE